MPNPAELFEAATQATHKVLGGVQESQMNDSTPCAGWNVQQLVEHVVGGAGYASVALVGPHPQPGDPSQSTVDAYDANVRKTLEACQQAGAMEKLV